MLIVDTLHFKSFVDDVIKQKAVDWIHRVVN